MMRIFGALLVFAILANGYLYATAYPLVTTIATFLAGVILGVVVTEVRK